MRSSGRSVLVTGGLGFIGSRVCEALLDRGERVRCVDNLSAVYATGTGREAAALLSARGAEVRVSDAQPQQLCGVDAVIHLAALPGVRSAHPDSELCRTNVELTARLADAAAARGARFVFVSSSSVYGDARELPTPEDAEPAPLNPYARSKVAAEAAVAASGAEAVIVRPFTVYGPGQRPEMAFARWIEAVGRHEPVPFHAPPGAARDFTYVDDAVRGLMAALDHGLPGAAYNISGWRPVELRSALELLGSPPIRELPVSSADALFTWGAGTKAAAQLGYEPRVELVAGLTRQVRAATRRRPRPRPPARARGPALPGPSRSGSGS